MLKELTSPCFVLIEQLTLRLSFSLSSSHIFYSLLLSLSSLFFVHACPLSLVSNLCCACGNSWFDFCLFSCPTGWFQGGRVWMWGCFSIHKPARAECSHSQCGFLCWYKNRDTVETLSFTTRTEIENLLAAQDGKSWEGESSGNETFVCNCGRNSARFGDKSAPFLCLWVATGNFKL